jgi:hypothetical protein
MTTPPSAAMPPMSGDQAGIYQRLRAHLAYLKLPTAAEHLPAVLDAARTNSWVSPPPWNGGSSWRSPPPRTDV